MPPYSGFKPLVGGGAQRAPLPTAAPGITPSGLAATAGADSGEPRRSAEPSLRSTFVDREEAAMLRALARLNGDDQKSRDRGNSFSQTNRTRQAARAREAAAMGLTPLDPLEQHELARKMAAGYTSISERAVRVPKVGGPAPRPRFAPVDCIPRRKGEETIRQENDDFERPAAPPGRPVKSSDERKDELALRNQFNGRSPQELLAAHGGIQQSKHPQRRPRGMQQGGAASAGASAAPPSQLRGQIEDEVAERHEFLDRMSELGRCDARMRERIVCEISERLGDLKRLDELGDVGGGSAALAG